MPNGFRTIWTIQGGAAGLQLWNMPGIIDIYCFRALAELFLLEFPAAPTL